MSPPPRPSFVCRARSRRLKISWDHVSTDQLAHSNGNFAESVIFLSSQQKFPLLINLSTRDPNFLNSDPELEVY